MKFVLKPSLEHMALVKIVISLWNQNDVRTLISKLNPKNMYPSKKWKTVEQRVIQKVSHLLLPQLLQEKLLGVIKPIGSEISMWMEYNHEILDVNLPVELCWTPQGTVDQKRTAEVLVKDNNLDIFTLYKLACEYCLVDDITRLWNRLPEDPKDYDWDNSPVIHFWSDYMKRGEVNRFYYKEAFYVSAINNNKAAAEYFLQKLTPQERVVENLVGAAKCTENADVLCLLLSKLSEEKQMEVFRSVFYRAVLICFLRWPWQSFFVGVANSMWDLISKEDYYDVLTDIICKVRDGYKDWNYQKLFEEFWKKSPRALKSLITNEIDQSELLPSLFDIKDKENIRLILKDTSLTVKKKLIYSNKMKHFCKRSICANEWDFLEFCIRECFPSKIEMLKFKEEFENQMSHSFKQNFATKKHIWDKLFHFPDDSICESDKRSVEDGESSSSKRFQRMQ